MLSLERGECVVCIPVYGAPELLARCLRSVLNHTPSAVPVLIADDCSPDQGIGPLSKTCRTRRCWTDPSTSSGSPRSCLFLVENVNSAFISC